MRGEIDPIIEQAQSILEFCAKYCEGTQIKLHETIAALDIAKQCLYNKWGQEHQKWFDDELKKLSEGDKP